MHKFLVYFTLILNLLQFHNCEVNLQIVKNIDDFYTPVNAPVEEKVGTTFSLICELVSSNNDNELFDENLSWHRIERYTHDNRSVSVDKKLPTNERTRINKSEKRFSPLKYSDKGRYYCLSLKFNLHKDVQVIVRDEGRYFESRPMRDSIMCPDKRFQCVSNGFCIPQHYVCDGKADCKDKSDESEDLCDGDACKDKIHCDDGRCIPTAWCCDRHHDANCTVTNRPTCCQVLSEPYEEMEYGFPDIAHASNSNGARLFISVCIVSITCFIIVLLLILSKVVIFAKKASLQRHATNFCDGIPLRTQTNINLIPLRSCDASIYNNCRNSSRTPRSNFSRHIIIDSSDISDPLLYPPGFNLAQDQPPSYVDVLRNNRALSEPPPPYTSREMLNVEERNS